MTAFEITDFSDQFAEYVGGVLDGDIVACKMLRYACQRHVDDIAREDDNDFGFWFDMESANVVLTIMSHFRVPIGKYAGQPFVPFDYQVFIMAMLYGWREKRAQTFKTFDADGNPFEYEGYLRRFTEAFLTMARGNAKTPISAINAIIQVAYDRPWIPGAEVYLTATSEEETDKAFDYASMLVKDSNIEGFECFEKAIIYEKRNYIKKIPAVRGDSFEIQCVVRDELHAWHNKKHRKFYGKLRTGLGKRLQPLAITTTTAGDDQSAMWIEELAYARQVLDPNNSLEDDRLFAFICELDQAEIDPLTGDAVGDSDDIYDESAWPKANPAMKYGIINVGEIQRLCNKAKSGDKASEKDLRRYHLNIRTSSKIKIFEPSTWAIGHGVSIDVDNNSPEILGLDIGYTGDPSSLASLKLGPTVERWLPDEHGEEKRINAPTFSLDCQMWVPEKGGIDITSGFWPAWKKSGVVKVCPGEEVQISFIRHRITEMIRQEKRNIYCVVADRAWSRELLQWIEEEFGIVVIKFTQSCWQYNEPMRAFITANGDGRIAHNNPMLDWCSDNLVAKKDAGNRMMPDKDSSKEKIDGTVASIMAFAGAMYEKPKRRKSVYRSRGFQVV